MKNEENPYKLIGARIKEARDAAGISQKDLAEYVGFESATAVSLIEAGERKVSVNDLDKFAEYLHRDIKFFLGKDETPSFRTALRADKDLTPKDQKQIMDFVDFIKKQKDA
jgi:transcriptional regulator with XRE-family HTH domain